mmetsp:Transcript_28874/g.90299  ORF Transcript_28874/g.90299 Transcript_28874/m.90299 type:complete len:269 (-) Transcript_28874:885-1691(-)
MAARRLWHPWRDARRRLWCARDGAERAERVRRLAWLARVWPLEGDHDLRAPRPLTLRGGGALHRHIHGRPQETHDPCQPRVRLWHPVRRVQSVGGARGRCRGHAASSRLQTARLAPQERPRRLHPHVRAACARACHLVRRARGAGGRGPSALRLDGRADGGDGSARGPRGRRLPDQLVWRLLVATALHPGRARQPSRSGDRRGADARLPHCESSKGEAAAAVARPEPNLWACQRGGPREGHLAQVLASGRQRVPLTSRGEYPRPLRAA